MAGIETGLLIGLIGGGTVLSVGLWRYRRPDRVIWRAGIVAAYLLGTLVLVGLVRSPGNTTEADAINRLDVALGNGQPTLVMLYSHFCADCVAVLPAIQTLDADLEQAGHRVDVLTIDIDSDLGAAASDRLRFEGPMTFVLMDAEGDEVLRSDHLPDIDQVRSALQTDA